MQSTLSLPLQEKSCPELVWPVCDSPGPDSAFWPCYLARCGCPYVLFRQNTRNETFLRNLLTITRILGGVNEWDAARPHDSYSFQTSIFCPDFYPWHARRRPRTGQPDRRPDQALRSRVTGSGAPSTSRPPAQSPRAAGCSGCCRGCGRCPAAAGECRSSSRFP